MRNWTLRGLYWFGSECSLLGRIATGGRDFWPSQAALAIGIFYLVGPIDLIPGRTPFIGHLDELAFLVLGLVAAHRLVPTEYKVRPRASTGMPGLAPSIPARIPNFFMVGAPRCGTTSLFAALSSHPDVFCCPVKEPNHFATDRNARPTVIASALRRGALLTAGAPGLKVLPRVATTPDFDTYLHLFDGWTGEHAAGEASTSYLFSKTAAGEIAKRQPDARIIIVLRNPVDRTRSEYLMHSQLGRKMGDIAAGDAVIANADDEDSISFSTIVEASLYAPQIERYLRVFAREQLLILRFEELTSAPADVFRKVFAHLGVDPDVSVERKLSHLNQGRPVRFPVLNRLLFKSGFRDVLLHSLPGPVKRLLARRYYKAGATVGPDIPLSLFRADIEETERLTGLDLSSWLRDGSK